MNVVGSVRSAAPFLEPQYEQLQTQFDAETGVYWAFMNPGLARASVRACCST
jgi:hypothetical protein